MATKTPIDSESPRSLEDVDLTPRGRVYPSPRTWRDQIFYQLLPDRFSDGNEGDRPMFDYRHPDTYKVHDKATWMAAGDRFTGGKIRGITSKLDYLQGLGVTTLWINPPWKQRVDLETYHGYGIQNFLEIDPRFGTRQDLRDLIDAAHDRGMYVILDVIFNHSGNNWFYRDELTAEPKSTMPYRFAPPYPVHGWRSSEGKSIPEPITLEDGAWPKEFQNIDVYTRSGEIGDWGVAPWEDPLSPFVQYRRGDFYDLKDLNLEDPVTLPIVIKAYEYWIALTDCDGFRLDAVKHISPAACGIFCRAIHQFAESIGKENFFITGEITDASIAPSYVDLFGRNLNAVLGINRGPGLLTGLAKGLIGSRDFFAMYDDKQATGLALQTGQFVVNVLDDHDMSSRARKERFAANNPAVDLYQQVAHVVGIQLTIPGIPSIYYGTEQAFDGNEGYHDYSVEPRRFAEDRYVREDMFGGAFGAFATAGCHFFNPDHPTYVRIAAIARLRNGRKSIGRTLRRGFLYPRETSYAGYPFALPPSGEVIAWSMVHYNTEVLIVFNSHSLENRGADVTIDASIHPRGSHLTYLYRGDWNEGQLKDSPPKETVVVDYHTDGRATVSIDLPPSGMAILSAFAD
ncbi:alpha-amylase family glycosyl hydrolase [Pannus brasiliensis CCIBt3594]|uniref:Alpha-amylase family glycosyl hydrolase n=1 Tax=Pannus brasiliensis CCIBt3594 TaxID=1427578 RepID=A0AAW9QGL5_9CHRO